MSSLPPPLLSVLCTPPEARITMVILQERTRSQKFIDEILYMRRVQVWVWDVPHACTSIITWRGTMLTISRRTIDENWTRSCRYNIYSGLFMVSHLFPFLSSSCKNPFEEIYRIHRVTHSREERIRDISSLNTALSNIKINYIHPVRRH